ncbi:ester cyclase [uncultured Tolumonas sp.]|uniref:ester cyclase n=1 Tax=uncultured Tolumonas sp. TaxID=263765 RepID=UPI00292CEB9F|nr:ester cyclase [uncultured Tolumonas sp.]
MKTQLTHVALALVLATSATAAFAESKTTTAADRAEIDALKVQVNAIAKTRHTEKAHLANFDDLDFNVYSGQKWDQLGKSHAKDITVHYPDGHTTKGLDKHIEELKPMFVFAPNTKITEHPIRIASGEWTAVSGSVDGTFSQPMPIGDGKTIAPTGKSFKLGMVTIGHWNKQGVMDEEWLMWDNQSFMKQIGLAQ